MANSDVDTLARAPAEPKQWVSDWVRATLDETPGRPERVAISTADETRASAKYEGGACRDLPPAQSTRTSELRKRVRNLVASFRSVLVPLGSIDAVDRANAIEDFLNYAEGFLHYADSSKADETYFDLGALVQQAALQWSLQPARWDDPKLPETTRALDRLQSVSPLVSEDVENLVAALTADSVDPFTPVD